MPKKLIIDEAKSTPEAQAARIRRARNIANLTRQQVCENSDININTLKGWEIGRYGGLSKVGAKKLVARFAQEGVICSAEWLLYEIGESPKLLDNFYKLKQVTMSADSEISSIQDSEYMTEELLLFRKHHPAAMDFQVDDDGMMPFYHPGDVVAGIMRQGKTIQRLIGTSVIAQFPDGKMLLRQLQAGSQPHLYTLHCLNPMSSVKEPIIYNIELFAAAAVIWQRRNKGRF